jgi:hypothetical protein
LLEARSDSASVDDVNDNYADWFGNRICERLSQRLGEYKNENEQLEELLQVRLPITSLHVAVCSRVILQEVSPEQRANPSERIYPRNCATLRVRVRVLEGLPWRFSAYDYNLETTPRKKLVHPRIVPHRL